MEVATIHFFHSSIVTKIEKQFELKNVGSSDKNGTLQSSDDNSRISITTLSDATAIS